MTIRPTSITLSAFIVCMGASAAQTVFNPPVRLDPGVSLFRPSLDVAYGDFNGDLELDYAYTDSILLEVFVVLSDGSGGFGATATLPYFFGTGPGGGGPQMVEVLDVNADGHLDLVCPHRDDSQSPGVLRWLPGAGDGTFGAPVVLGTGLRTVSAMEAADLDGDDLKEIVAISAGGQEGFVFSQSSPGSAFTSTQIVTTVGNGVGDLELGDLDADGDLDIVFLVRDRSRIFAIENLGAGAYAAPVPISGVILQPGRIALADIDSDGDMDVACTRPGMGVIMFVLQDGDPFQPVWPTAPGFVYGGGGMVFTASDLSFGDLDFDGDQDLVFVQLPQSVTTNPTSAEILLNDGSGGYTRESGLSSPLDGFAYMIRVDDFDQDGALDVLAIDSNGLSIRTQVNPLVGERFCMAQANSTGEAAVLDAVGSAVAADNNLRLSGTGLPPNQFGVAVVSQSSNAGYQPAGTSGTLCIGTLAGADIGRYFGAAEIIMTTAIGFAGHSLDLQNTPSPAGRYGAQSGDTLHFQIWHRDVVGGAATSNFTAAVRVPLQ